MYDQLYQEFKQAWATLIQQQPERALVEEAVTIQMLAFLVDDERVPLYTSSRVFSAIILWIPIPTPSITPNSIAHPIAEFLAAFIPPRTAKAPPVKKPAMMAL